MDKKNLWGSVVEPLFLEQYKSATQWQKCLKSVIDRLQDVEDGAFVLSYYFAIPESYSAEAITSERLEYLASLKNVFRYSGESDQSLFERFIFECHTHDDGTVDSVLREVVRKSGDTSPSYLEEAPATFFVYTPDGSQLKRSQVKKLAPAGVLGLPGVALQDANGYFIVDSNGDKFLSAATDAAIEE